MGWLGRGLGLDFRGFGFVDGEGRSAVDEEAEAMGEVVVQHMFSAGGERKRSSCEDKTETGKSHLYLIYPTTTALIIHQ
jgi:hypothetical protein